MEFPIWLYAAFFGVAAVYSLFGFGGGSSYLAILVVAGFSYRSIPPIALACNIIVAASGFYQYARAGHFKLGKTLPFVILSVPMAYLGGSLTVSKKVFCLLLGFSLFFAGLRTLIDREFQINTPTNTRRWTLGLFAGGGIGFLSGLVGIGGGIFLSPLLLVARWADSKQAAAAAAFFILVNSAAALAAHVRKAPLEFSSIGPLVLIVFAGGLIGSRLGARHVPKLVLRRMLAVFIFYASFKLIGMAL